MKEASPISEELLLERLQPIKEEQKLTSDQYGQLHAWDVFMEELFPQMDADYKKMHEIKPFEMRQFEELR